MAPTRPWYITREAVKRALDVPPTASDNDQVDSAIEAACDDIDGEMHRVFYPTIATRYFDWPDYRSYGTAYRIWLDDDEVVSVEELKSADVTITDFFLEPVNSGPPFTVVEVNRDTVGSFTGGDTEQRNIEMTGVYGYTDATVLATELTSQVADTTTTVFDVADAAAVGTGDLIKVDDEWMLTIGKAMTDTGQTVLTDAMDAKANDVGINVGDESSFSAGETLLLGSERMQITDVSDRLTVKRAVDGTVLASHSTGTQIFAPRRLTVVRGSQGSTAATHNDETAVRRLLVPGPIRTYAKAKALVTLLNENSGYASTIGSGQNERRAAGTALHHAAEAAYSSYGRKARIRAV